MVKLDIFKTQGSSFWEVKSNLSIHRRPKLECVHTATIILWNLSIGYLTHIATGDDADTLHVNGSI